MGGLLRAVFDLWLPPICQACGQWDHPSSIDGLCGECLEAVAWRPPEAVFEAAREQAPTAPTGRLVACFYEPPLTQLIHSLKYGARRAAARPLALLMQAAWESTDRPVPLDVLVPVPMHPVKRWCRGIDHTRVLTEELAGLLRLPWSGRWLRRRRATLALSQAGRRSARRRALRGAFAARSHPGLCQARVGLVDDLLTTGETARACARALRCAGAGTVTVLAPAGNVPVRRGSD